LHDRNRRSKVLNEGARLFNRELQKATLLHVLNRQISSTFILRISVLFASKESDAIGSGPIFERFDSPANSERYNYREILI
jgi:hypothetical protein